jgi:CRP-like cAMP-binding protein
VVPASNPDIQPLIRKLETVVDLTQAERQALLGLPMTVRQLKADQDIIRDHDRPSQCCLIVEGFAFRYKIIGDGRQILSWHIPGDIPDMQSLHLDLMDHSLATLVPSKVAFITHETVRGLIRAHPRIGDVFWRETLVDAGIFREWMAGLGRREAYGRMARMLCEFFLRMDAVGLRQDGNVYELPFTQAEMADALGLSTVHVNRTVQDLTANGLIQIKKGLAVVKDWDGLRQAGEFDPTYLHIRKMAA